MLETKRKATNNFWNPYQVRKNVFDPKCAIQLQCNQSLLATFKAKTLSNPSHSILLPLLDELSTAPTLLKDFDSTSSTLCADIKTPNCRIDYLFRIFNYSYKRFDSLKKECSANFLPFCRDFWGDNSSRLPWSFY